jgi:hypothetical protein
LKHLYVYVDLAGIAIRLTAERTWIGPLVEASAVVTRAEHPRSRPEQQQMTEWGTSTFECRQQLRHGHPAASAMPQPVKVM